jgi:hypothetical protein
VLTINQVLWLKFSSFTGSPIHPPLGALNNALSVAFGGRGKKRLNRVFDAIGVVYPDYRYPLRGQGK